MSVNVPEHISASGAGQPEPAEEVRVRRATDRASYDPSTVHQIIDACLVAHVGTVRDGLPVVIPMYCVRDGESLLLHGAPASGVLLRAQQGIAMCAELTSIDGLVMARSAFHHSVNYRSVVVIGEAVPVTDPEAKARALELFVERLAPGRQAELRPTTTKELRGTAVLCLPLDQASAKVRTGPPIDDEDDYAHEVWAGVVPVRTTFGSPEPDPRLDDGIDVPPNIAQLAGQAK